MALLHDPYDRLVWGATAVAVVLGRLLRWIGFNLEQRRPEEEREVLQLRRRETAIVLVATAT